jgi:DNA-binding protein HU-beta
MMNKGDLVAAVADATDLTKAQTGAVLDAVLDVITAQLKKGEEVRIVGFGTFSITKRPAGTARNPRTGEVIATKASNSPKFKVGQGLKDAVNGK